MLTTRWSYALFATTVAVATASCADDGGTSVFDTASAGSASATDGGSGDPSTSAGTATASGTGGTTSGDTDSGAGTSDGGTGPKFDVVGGGTDGNPTDTGGGDCGCGNDEWSYIWAANSSQSTVSKINTRTLEEEGRYYTRPDAAGNPSRTTVSLGGRAVAVANRNGGVVKIWAREQFCEDRNNNGTIETSSGKNDIMAWDTDECVAWYTAFPGYTAQRPIAWAGDVNAQTCDDERLWTSGCGGGSVNVHLLDGTNGDILEDIAIPEMPCGTFGAYGGAVDPDGHFWIMQNGGGIARIDLQTFQHEYHAAPQGFSGYGITVDNKARVWLSGYAAPYGAARFDPASNTWDTATGFPAVGQGGIQQGEDLRIWLSNGNGISWVDPETLVVGGSFDGAIMTNGGTISGSVKGVSLDVDGYVWAVLGGGAGKWDPDTLTMVDAYTGLNGAYTYSDMTGWGLQNANCNPPEG